MGERRCVVLGDVIGSRQVDDRAAVGKALEAGLAQANERAADAVHAPFTVLKGVDEVGGVLTTPGPVYTVIQTIAEAIHPHEIRFGVAWDIVDVAADSDDVAVMDGPAFHHADARRSDVADQDRYVGLDLDALAEPPVSTLLAGQCDLLFLWKSAWTPRQCEVVRAYRDAETMTAVAEDLGVAVNTVSRTLQRAHAHPLLAIEAELRDAFSQLGPEDPHEQT